jgi:hypothetical protein
LKRAKQKTGNLPGFLFVAPLATLMPLVLYITLQSAATPVLNESLFSLCLSIEKKDSEGKA